MPTNKEIGYAGENAVCKYLESRGFSVLERNYTAGHEEIDIIAKDEKYIVFCEVKTRKFAAQENRFGRPGLAVNAEKRAHLLRCARQYLKQTYGTDRPPSLQPRMDVAEVWYEERPDGLSFRIRYIARAFGTG